MISLSKQHIATIKDAAKKLTGAIRRYRRKRKMTIDFKRFLGNKNSWQRK
jgi:isocitrate dehydrogenase